MSGAEGGELLGRATVLQAAAGVQVGQNHRLLRRQDLGRLRHEAHPAECDDVGIGLRRAAREVEAVADEIGQILQLGLLVIMCQDDGIALTAQAVDLGTQVEAGEIGL